MQKLIINADDFGYSKEINQGILEAHKAGTVTSTTIMTNEQFFEHAISIYPKSLGLGVHLNLTWGNSLSTNKPFFKYNKHLSVLGLINKEKAEKEFRQQIEKLLEIGIQPDHLDTHHHIHAFSPINRLLIKLAKEYRIYKIRWPKEKLTSLNWKQILINNKLGKCPITTTDNFFGIKGTNNPTLNQFISYLNFKGTAEICCHPGKESSSSQDKLKSSRPKELEILTNPKFLEEIKQRKIQLINFKEL
jgi:predicted glycoside hydrolase/deacetylase ChbG (UPF0249 family)